MLYSLICNFNICVLVGLNTTDFIVVCQLSYLAKAVHQTPLSRFITPTSFDELLRWMQHLINKQLLEHLSFAQTVWSLHPGSNFQIITLSAQWPNWGILLPRPIRKTGGRYASFRLNRRSTAQPISHISHLVYYAYFGPDFCLTRLIIGPTENTTRNT